MGGVLFFAKRSLASYRRTSSLEPKCSGRAPGFFFWVKFCEDLRCLSHVDASCRSSLVTCSTKLMESVEMK